LKCAVVSLYSVVKQQLKSSTNKECNCLIQFLLTVVLSIEEHDLVEYVFREGNRYTILVQEQFAEKFPETPIPHHNAVRRLIEKFRETGSVLDAERSGRQSKLNDKKLMDILTACCGVHLNRCATWRKTWISGLQQRIKRSENTEPLPMQSNSGARIETGGSLKRICY
jgi:hypothetical protein